MLGSGELSFTGILHAKLAERVKKNKNILVYYIIYIIEKTLLNLIQRAVNLCFSVLNLRSGVTCYTGILHLEYVQRVNYIKIIIYTLFLYI